MYRALMRAVSAISTTVSSSPILGGAALVGIATLSAKGVSLLKDVAVADRIGLTAELDVFLFGLTLLELILSFLLGALQCSFIPVVARARHGGDESSVQGLFSSVMSILLAIVLACSVIVWFLAPHLAGLTGMDEVTTAGQLASVCRWATPILFLLSFSTLCQGLLQARRVFFLPTLTRILSPLCLGLAVWFFGNRGNTLFLLTMSTVFGAFLEALLMGFLLSRHGVRPIPGKIRFSPELRTLMTQTGFLMVGTACTAAVVIVERSFAAQAGVGGVSSLAYANKLSSVVSGLIVVSLSASILPHLSLLCATGDYSSARATVHRYTFWLFVGMLPFALLTAVFSVDIVRLLFERGAFLAEDSARVGAIQTIYLLSIPFVIAGVASNRMVLALGMNELLTYVSIADLLITVVLNMLLFPLIGLLGIALTHLIVQAFNTVACVYFARRASRLRHA